MKKLINEVGNYVTEMLDGLVAAVPSLRRVEGTQVLLRANLKDKVGLVSGGGSGHEPAHAGYVGTGMLDAAVAGEVFTSPTPDQILTAIRAVHRGKGVLLIVKNYTGDVMNFEMAADLAHAQGIEVAQVVVDDDVAVEGSTYTVGRRGIAGTVWVHKIAGAAAEAGLSLEEVQRVASKVVTHVRSMGMALSACTVPAHGRPSFALADSEVEMGIGIHGEPGVERRKLESSADTVDFLLERIFANLSLQSGDAVAVMVNGLGATPLSELYIANRRVAEVCQEKNLQVQQTLVGEFMTSLEMAGFSLSVLKLDEELQNYLNAPAYAPAWPQTERGE